MGVMFLSLNFPREGAASGRVYFENNCDAGDLHLCSTCRAYAVDKYSTKQTSLIRCREGCGREAGSGKRNQARSQAVVEHIIGQICYTAAKHRRHWSCTSRYAWGAELGPTGCRVPALTYLSWLGSIWISPARRAQTT